MQLNRSETLVSTTHSERQPPLTLGALLLLSFSFPVQQADVRPYRLHRRRRPDRLSRPSCYESKIGVRHTLLHISTRLTGNL